MDEQNLEAQLKAIFIETLKGGPGSGNFGHAGRPGKIGGSAPDRSGSGIAQGKKLSREDKIRLGLESIGGKPYVLDKLPENPAELRDGAGYNGYLGSMWITPEGKVVLVDKNTTHTMIANALILSNPDDYPAEMVSRAIFDTREEIGNYTMQDNNRKANVEFFEDEVVEGYFEDKGWTRITVQSGRFTYDANATNGRVKHSFTSMVIRTPIRMQFARTWMRRIQKWFDDGTLPQSIKELTIYDTVAHRNVTFDIYRIMASSTFIKNISGGIAIKQRTKGGPGSGNFGHAGRPGKVGGSAPDRSGGGIAMGKAVMPSRDEVRRIVKEKVHFFGYKERFDHSPERPPYPFVGADAKADEIDDEMADAITDTLLDIGETTGVNPLDFVKKIYIVEDDLSLAYGTATTGDYGRRGTINFDALVNPSELATMTEAEIRQMRYELYVRKGRYEKTAGTYSDGVIFVLKPRPDSDEMDEFTKKIRALPKHQNKLYAGSSRTGLYDGTMETLAKRHTLDTLVHEIAHAMYFGGKSVRWYTTFSKKWRDAYKKDALFDRKTIYAKTSSAEGFADTFAYFMAVKNKRRFREGVNYSDEADQAQTRDFEIMQAVFDEISTSKKESARSSFSSSTETTLLKPQLDYVELLETKFDAQNPNVITYLAVAYDAMPDVKMLRLQQMQADKRMDNLDLETFLDTEIEVWGKPHSESGISVYSTDRNKAIGWTARHGEQLACLKIKPQEIVGYIPSKKAVLVQFDASAMSENIEIVNDLKEIVETVFKGGPGSGNFGHAGRPGKVGGSAPDRSGGGVAEGVTPDYKNHILKIANPYTAKQDSHYVPYEWWGGINESRGGIIPSFTDEADDKDAQESAVEYVKDNMSVTSLKFEGASKPPDLQFKVAFPKDHALHGTELTILTVGEETGGHKAHELARNTAAFIIASTKKLPKRLFDDYPSPGIFVDYRFSGTAGAHYVVDSNYIIVYGNGFGFAEKGGLASSLLMHEIGHMVYEHGSFSTGAMRKSWDKKWANFTIDHFSVYSRSKSHEGFAESFSAAINGKSKYHPMYGATVRMDELFNKTMKDVVKFWNGDPKEYNLDSFSTKGGPGSGNFGHSGRPGKVGGSAPDKADAGDVVAGRRYTPQEESQIRDTVRQQLSKKLRIGGYQYDDPEKLVSYGVPKKYAEIAKFVEDSVVEQIMLTDKNPLDCVSAVVIVRSEFEAVEAIVENTPEDKMLSSDGKKLNRDDFELATTASVLLMEKPIGLCYSSVICLLPNNASRTSGSEGWRQTIAHEFGHAIYNNGNKNNRTSWNGAYKRDPYFGKRTVYATKSAREGFAESYGCYIFGNQYKGSEGYFGSADDFSAVYDFLSEIPSISLKERLQKAFETYKGGPGSGNFGHAGRPGKVGGSQPKEGSLGGIAGGSGMILVAHETSNLDDLKMLVSQGMRRDFKPQLNFEGDYAPGKGLDREGTYVSSPEKLSGGYGRYTVEFEVSRDEIGVPGEMTALGHGQTDEDIDSALNESTLGAVTVKDIDPDRIVRIREYDPSTHKTTTYTRDEFLRKYKLTKIGKLPGAQGYRELLQRAVKKGLVLESMVDQELENYLRSNLEDKAYLVDDLSVSLKGGPGSGNFGHAGRPGKVGGSAPDRSGGGIAMGKKKKLPTREEIRETLKKKAVFVSTKVIKKKGPHGMTEVTFGKTERKEVPPEIFETMVDSVQSASEMAGIDVMDYVDRILYVDDIDSLTAFTINESVYNAKYVTRLRANLKSSHPSWTDGEITAYIFNAMRETGFGLYEDGTLIVRRLNKTEFADYMRMGKTGDGKAIPKEDYEKYRLARFQDTLVHEIGHAIYFGGGEAFSWNGSIVVRDFAKAWVERFNKDSNFDRMTMYSSHSPYESFAETFAYQHAVSKGRLYKMGMGVHDWAFPIKTQTRMMKELIRNAYPVGKTPPPSP